MINKHKSNKIQENSNTVRHLNNGTDHRHSKSCCDQSSPARRTITRFMGPTWGPPGADRRRPLLCRSQLLPKWHHSCQDGGLFNLLEPYFVYFRYYLLCNLHSYCTTLSHLSHTHTTQHNINMHIYTHGNISHGNYSGRGNGYPSSWRTKYCIFNAMAAATMATQGARASTILTPKGTG